MYQASCSVFTLGTVQLHTSMNDPNYASLLGMVAGLAMLTMPALPYLERWVLWLMLWGPDKMLHCIILKNLHAHRQQASINMLYTMIDAI